MRFDALNRFVTDEAGAMSIDAVVVIGGAMLIAQAVVTDVSQGMFTIGNKMNTHFEQVAETHVEQAQTVYTKGNPGNDKVVGNAGENPDGTDDWGDGTSGKSQ